MHWKVVREILESISPMIFAHDISRGLLCTSFVAANPASLLFSLVLIFCMAPSGQEPVSLLLYGTMRFDGITVITKEGD